MDLKSPTPSAVGPSTSQGDFEMQTDSRILHVYFEGWKMDHIRVCDSDKTTILYTADLRLTKPHITLHSTSQPIANINFHTLSTRIDATLHSRPISLTAHGLLKLPYSYDSPAFGGVTMTWKPRSKWDELKLALLDDKAMPVARFEPTEWSTKKSGKFELLERGVESEAVMDEVVATGLAVVCYRQLQRAAAAV